MNKLSLKYLKKKKSNTITIVLIIAFSTLIIVGLNVLKVSQYKNNIELIKQSVGSYSFEFFKLNEREVEKIKNRENIKNIEYVKELQQSSLDNGLKVSFLSENKNYFKEKRYNFIKGKKETKIGTNEVIIEKKL